MACGVIFSKGIPCAESEHSGLVLYVFSGYGAFPRGEQPMDILLRYNGFKTKLVLSEKAP